MLLKMYWKCVPSTCRRIPFSQCDVMLSGWKKPIIVYGIVSVFILIYGTKSLTLRIIFSSRLSCDFRPLTVIPDDLRVISDAFCEVITGKNIVEEIDRFDHRRPCGKEFTLVSLYSTEIARYHSWFLEYKLTRVNSVPHGRPCWILFFCAWFH